MRKNMICECGKTALWQYAGDAWYACDDCVERGCYCNMQLKEGIEEARDPDDDCIIINPATDYEALKDASGRDYPCVDWSYTPNGVIDYEGSGWLSFFGPSQEWRGTVGAFGNLFGHTYTVHLFTEESEWGWSNDHGMWGFSLGRFLQIHGMKVSTKRRPSTRTRNR